MYNPQTHYRALFSVEKKNQLDEHDIFKRLVSHMGGWLKTHEFFRELGAHIFKRELYVGGKKVFGNKNACFEVKTNNYNEELRIPSAWVMRMEHFDNNYRQRKWRIDVAMSNIRPEYCELSVTVTRFLRDDYMGEEPPVPPSSVPRFVSKILNDDFLKCSVGAKKIESNAQVLKAGEGRPLYQFITHPGRIVPVIVINIQHAKNIVVPDGLQKLVLGSGIVYYYDDQYVHQELAYDWGQAVDHYQCRPDSIRVYLPELNVASYNDWKRHRYFSLNDYLNNPEDLLRVISQSVFRVSFRNVPFDHITNFETLYILQQRQRVQQLRAAAANSQRSKEEEEYLTALEDENVRTTSALKTNENALNSERERNITLEIQIEELTDQLKVTREQFGQVTQTQKHLQEHMENVNSLRSCFQTFPSSILELVNLLETLYPDKVHFLDEARQSAEDASFNILSEAWEVLVKTATTLYALYFEKDSKNIELDFKNETGYEVSLKEGGQTKNDAKLMALRTRLYEGNSISILPHVKLDKSQKHLRVHYFVDRTKNLLIIGHCGDHLDTAGTQRRKERA
jgi:hypothetical protein